MKYRAALRKMATVHILYSIWPPLECRAVCTQPTCAVCCTLVLDVDLCATAGRAFNKDGGGAVVTAAGRLLLVTLQLPTLLLLGRRVAEPLLQLRIELFAVLRMLLLLLMLLELLVLLRRLHPLEQLLLLLRRDRPVLLLLVMLVAMMVTLVPNEGCLAINTTCDNSMAVVEQQNKPTEFAGLDTSF